jgi:PIN domain nuclease of toxin-antitoxin system
VGSLLTTVLLDTHAFYWWNAEPDRLSAPATSAVEDADELAVAAISWYELAWLIKRERIRIDIPARSWLHELAVGVRTVAITPAIADTASSLPRSFPGDSADRLIYATAIEGGWRLVTSDRRMRDHRHPRPVTVW